MKLSISKNIKFLSLAFLLIFLGFNGAQQYVTSFFSQIGLPDLGFQSLILIYVFFTLSDPLASIFVSKFGAKKAMMVGVIAYGLYILFLPTKLPIIIYLASILIGIGASLLWTGQNSYLVRASEEKSYGKNSGYFNTLTMIGSALGVILLGFLITRISYGQSFIIASLFSFVGILFILPLKDFRTENLGNHFKLIRHALGSRIALQLSILWFSFSIVFGFAIGLIPIQLKNTLGIDYVGLSSLFFIMPIVLSYFIGKLSDIKGRNQIIIISFILCIVGLGLLYFYSNPVALVAGLILLSLNNAVISPMRYALVGDFTTAKNLDYLTGLFWMMQGVGTIFALVLSVIIDVKAAYLISIIVLIASFFILLPILKSNPQKIKEKISLEVC